MAENNGKTLRLLSPFLKGIGQIMLQDNALSGLLMLIGICCGSLLSGVTAIVGVFVGTMTAKLLRYNKAETDAGLYGFSATLVAVAMVYFFKPTIIIWILIVIGAALASILQHYFIQKKIPGFTFPFILIVWLFFFAAHFGAFPLNASAATVSPFSYVNIVPLTFGEVIFQEHTLAGILFLAAILINQPIAAVYATMAAVLSGVIAYEFAEPSKDIYMGLLGYNAVLCAIVFAGKRRGDMLLAFISVVLSVWITMLMRHQQLLALTFPFVLSTWLTLLLKKVRPRLQWRLKP